MERDLLARFTGDGGRWLQGQDPRPPLSPTLSLRVGCEEAQQSRVDATVRGHGHAPQQAAASMVAPRPSSSRVPFTSRLVSVVVPGHPAPQRRPDPRAGASARPQTGGQTAWAQWFSSAELAQRPPVDPVPTLRIAGPATTTTAGQEHCDARSLCAQLLQEVTSDLDRARAQVALLTCENESLRHRLKRAAAAALARLHGPSSGAGLRCRSCRVRPATVVLVPRDHLCLCRHCSCSGRALSIGCPVCAAALIGTAEAAPR